MTTKSSPFPTPSTFDHSMVDCFRDCPRRYFLSFIRRWQTSSEPIYFTAGRAWGEGLQRFHSAKSRGDSLASSVLLGQSAIIEEFARVNTPLGIPPRDPKTLTRLLLNYSTQYSQTEPWFWKGSEIGFQFPLPGLPDIYLGGALDGYISWPDYGVLAFEAKTTSGYITDSSTTQWSLSWQPSFYTWAISQISETPCVGCLFDLTTFRPSKSGPVHTRFLEIRSPERLSQFEFNVRTLIEDILFEHERNLWLPLGRFCSGGYGLKPCTYRALCLSLESRGSAELLDPSTPPPIGLIEAEPWEPWNRWLN